MNAEKIYNDIQQLPVLAGEIRQRESKAISFLQRLYFDVTGSDVYAGCKGCHIKAANYLTSLSLNDLKKMASQKFKLKKGNRIEYPFRSGRLITEENLTDELAVQMLLNNPAMVSGFADYPKDETGNIDLTEWYPKDESVIEEQKPKGKSKINTEEVNG